MEFKVVEVDPGEYCIVSPNTMLFDEGEPSGSQVVESNYEKRVGQANAEAQEHVPAHHPAQQGTSGS